MGKRPSIKTVKRLDSQMWAGGVRPKLYLARSAAMCLSWHGLSRPKWSGLSESKMATVLSTNFLCDMKQLVWMTYTVRNTSSL